MKLLRNPFPVKGSIRQCWLFVYRLPLAIAQKMLPVPLELVTRDGFAFMNIVVCRLSGMRPAPLPAETGLGYWHVAYRLHASVETTLGLPLEGLCFLRSDCDHWAVEKCGNLLTDFHFHRAKIRVSATADAVDGTVLSLGAAAHFRIERNASPQQAEGSPFDSLQEAASFLKYKPLALSVIDAETVQLLRVRRNETEWKSRLVSVPEAEWEFLAGCDARLEVCYEVEPIEYRWERGQNVRVRVCV